MSLLWLALWIALFWHGLGLLVASFGVPILEQVTWGLLICLAYWFVLFAIEIPKESEPK
jgi:hypothetical protein